MHLCSVCFTPCISSELWLEFWKFWVTGNTSHLTESSIAYRSLTYRLYLHAYTSPAFINSMINFIKTVNQLESGSARDFFVSHQPHPLLVKKSVIEKHLVTRPSQLYLLSFSCLLCCPFFLHTGARPCALTHCLNVVLIHVHNRVWWQTEIMPSDLKQAGELTD